LDEIGDISHALQVRLLRVLEERKYEPLGAIKAFATNARVVVASNVDLDQLVEEKKFRKDLYFRINVMRLALPRLTERKEDISLLVDHFIDRLNKKQNKKKILGISEEAKAALVLYDWPGNIRELQNAIEHAFVICKTELIALHDLPEKILSTVHVGAMGWGTSLKEVERNAILQTLNRNRWKKSITAQELGINKNTLRRKIVAYGLAANPLRGKTYVESHIAPDA